MFEMLTGNSLWILVKNTDVLSKIVMITLFVMSVLCWAIFLCKSIILRMRKRDIRRVYDQLHAIRSINDLATIAAHFSYTMPGRFLSQTLIILSTLEELQPDKARRNWEIMQYHIEQTTDRLMMQEESYLPVLSTSAGIATLLGLFGTVWGLIHAFMSISERQSADITVVAPGIAAALLTTLAGLVVAIPALVMYNYLLNQVRTVDMQIVSLADKVSFIMQQALLG